MSTVRSAAAAIMDSDGLRFSAPEEFFYPRECSRTRTIWLEAGSTKEDEIRAPSKQLAYKWQVFSSLFLMGSKKACI